MSIYLNNKKWFILASLLLLVGGTILGVYLGRNHQQKEHKDTTWEWKISNPQFVGLLLGFIISSFLIVVGYIVLHIQNSKNQFDSSPKKMNYPSRIIDENDFEILNPLINLDKIFNDNKNTP
jgi:hypothetical protein